MDHDIVWMSMWCWLISSLSFAVLDPLALTLWINCSVLHLYLLFYYYFSFWLEYISVYSPKKFSKALKIWLFDNNSNDWQHFHCACMEVVWYCTAWDAFRSILNHFLIKYCIMEETLRYCLKNPIKYYYRTSEVSVTFVTSGCTLGQTLQRPQSWVVCLAGRSPQR